MNSRSDSELTGVDFCDAYWKGIDGLFFRNDSCKPTFKRMSYEVAKKHFTGDLWAEEVAAPSCTRVAQTLSTLTVGRRRCVLRRKQCT